MPPCRVQQNEIKSTALAQPRGGGVEGAFVKLALSASYQVCRCDLLTALFSFIFFLFKPAVYNKKKFINTGTFVICVHGILYANRSVHYIFLWGFVRKADLTGRM